MASHAQQMNQQQEAEGGQAQLHRNESAQSDQSSENATLTSQASTFIQQTGESVMNMAQGAGESVMNMAQGATEAVKNTLGINAVDADSTINSSNAPATGNGVNPSNPNKDTATTTVTHLAASNESNQSNKH